MTDSDPPEFKLLIQPTLYQEPASRMPCSKTTFIFNHERPKSSPIMGLDEEYSMNYPILYPLR
jgi:hypothetical protein